MSNPIPKTTDPLVTTPETPAVGQPVKNGLGQLIHLVGTWNSVPDGEFSWNTMPLPQDDVHDGFILKNFPYLEEISFAEIPGTAPNRGSGFTQVANTLFYEQRVYFSPSSGGMFPVPPSAEYTLVHAENGSWLFLDVDRQFSGAFPPDGSAPVPLPDGVTSLPVQDPNTTIVKQMSVPHGNSILATGKVTPAAEFPVNPPPIVSPDNPGTPKLSTIDGVPSIPQLNAIPNFEGAPYGASKYGASVIKDGVETNANINTNIKLVNYLKANPPKNYIHFKVSAPAPAITNISFETKHAAVNSYDTEIWLLNPGTPEMALMYYQNIGMSMTLSSSTTTGTKVITFPHTTSNVVVPVKS